MSDKLNWEKLRYLGKETLSISKERITRLPEPTPEQRAQWKAENMDRHKASKKFKKDLKKRRKAMRREEERQRNQGAL